MKTILAIAVLTIVYVLAPAETETQIMHGCIDAGFAPDYCKGHARRMIEKREGA